jgi:hypothetical protein
MSPITAENRNAKDFQLQPEKILKTISSMATPMANTSSEEFSLLIKESNWNT